MNDHTDIAGLKLGSHHDRIDRTGIRRHGEPRGR
jgi:hypothetical protein